MLMVSVVTFIITVFDIAMVNFLSKISEKKQFHVFVSSLTRSVPGVCKK